MHILQIFLIFEAFGSAICECSLTSWETSFNKMGQSKCDENNYFINGLIRDDINKDNDKIDNLDEVECCDTSQLWSNIDVQVVYTDWTYALDDDLTWAHCPQGYFLQGLYRTDYHYLNHMKSARCAKPALHPFYYGSCYEQDISNSFDRHGKSSCKEGHYITGLYRGNNYYLHNLDRLKCCTMSENPQIVKNAEDLVEHIMDSTIVKMTTLADMLGYGNCNGTRGLNIGEDFERKEYTWEASQKLFWPQRDCKGIKCEERLSVEFGDWSIGVKDIIYGESVVDDLKSETVDTGTRINNDVTNTTETFEISKTVLDSITHSATNSWTSSHELGIALDFKLPFGLGSSSVSYKFKYDTTSSTTSAETTHSSRTFKIASTKTINAQSSAKYKVIVYKSRTTIPYTAVMIAKFSTEFRGFMKHGGSYGSSNTNYHYQYSNCADRPTFNYRFGSSSVPFYEALKKESESQSKPWLWNEMLRHNPTARQIINDLTNETQYTFLLHGTLSKVAGSKIDVIWESLNVLNTTRREAPDDKRVKVLNSNAPIIAAAGPNDSPPRIVYPDVSVYSNPMFVLKQFTVPVDRST